MNAAPRPEEEPHEPPTSLLLAVLAVPKRGAGKRAEYEWEKKRAGILSYPVVIVQRPVSGQRFTRPAHSEVPHSLTQLPATDGSEVEGS
jgi:hypothetical protein